MERASRMAGRNSEDKLTSDVDDSVLIKDDIAADALAIDESFIERAGHAMANDARTGVTMDLDRKMKITCNIDDALLDRKMATTDDSALSPGPIGNNNVNLASSGTLGSNPVVSFSGFLNLDSNIGSNSLSPREKSSSSGIDSKGLIHSKSDETMSKSNETIIKSSPRGEIIKPASHDGATISTPRDKVNEKPTAKDQSKKEHREKTLKLHKDDRNMLAFEEDDDKSPENTKRQHVVNQGTSGIYLDEQTQKPLNPPKKPNVQREKVDQKTISTLLLNQFNQCDAKPKVKDSQHSRICSRLKDIAIGKSTKGYQNYIRKVPIDQRTSEDPQTPNLRENVSAARFQVIYRKWRTALHMYDNV
uniref:Histone RNA hairpin-binding protein RNA-binding domain-containing protein n=2 Tax=Babesia bovis TaxID=5865 RepID=A7AQ18_BABBO|eukprot:XP_001612220.1 hypothetical protein [Babesia bovis T2Bo]